MHSYLCARLLGIDITHPKLKSLIRERKKQHYSLKNNLKITASAHLWINVIAGVELALYFLYCTLNISLKAQLM